jgi:tripartite-type tricarboxylate transporter receptor subunit TctC
MRHWLKVLTAGLVALATAPAFAQDYPNAQIRLVVPYPAGGTLDALTRILAPEVSKEFGQPVIVDNRPGASGIIGTGEVARSKPDGYTLLMVFDAHATHQLLNKNLPYDPVSSFEPISLLIKTPMIVLANVGYAPNNLREFIADAKANPGKITYGSVGIGSSTHLNMARFESVTGIKLVHVPYKGGAPAMQDLIAGHVNVMIGSPAFTKLGLASNKVKMLGQVASTRSPIFPDLPTGIEQGLTKDYEALLWMGISAPKGTPQNVTQKWRDVLAKVVKNPDVVSKLQVQGLDVYLSSGEEFGRLVAEEAAKWKRVVNELNISLE